MSHITVPADDRQVTVRIFPFTKQRLVINEIRVALDDSWPIRATTIAITGALARKATQDVLGHLLELLFGQLGVPHRPVVSLAFAEVSTH